MPQLKYTNYGRNRNYYELLTAFPKLAKTNKYGICSFGAKAVTRNQYSVGLYMCVCVCVFVYGSMYVSMLHVYV